MELFSEMPPELSVLLRDGVDAAARAPQPPMASQQPKTPKKRAEEEDRDEEEEGDERERDADVNWSISDSVAKKLSDKFASLSNGESEVTSLKAMKTMMKSGVKQQDIGAV